MRAQHFHPHTTKIIPYSPHFPPNHPFFPQCYRTCYRTHTIATLDTTGFFSFPYSPIFTHFTYFHPQNTPQTPSYQRFYDNTLQFHLFPSIKQPSIPYTPRLHPTFTYPSSTHMLSSCTIFHPNFPNHLLTLDL